MRDESGKYDLEERLLEYSTRMIRLVEKLSNTRAGKHVAGQLLRSGPARIRNMVKRKERNRRKTLFTRCGSG